MFEKLLVTAAVKNWTPISQIESERIERYSYEVLSRSLIRIVIAKG